MLNRVDGSDHDDPFREWREPSFSILFRKADPIGVEKTCCRRAMPVASWREERDWSSRVAEGLVWLVLAEEVEVG